MLTSFLRVGFILAFLCVGITTVIAQTDGEAYSLHLRSGTFVPPVGFVDDTHTAVDAIASTAWEGRSYTVVQFYRLPTDAERARYEAAGVHLLTYLPNNAYIVADEGKRHVSLTDFWADTNIRSALVLSTRDKVQPALFATYEAATKNTRTTNDAATQTRIVVHTYTGVNPITALAELLKHGGTPLPYPTAREKDWAKRGAITITIPLAQLDAIASVPFVEYVEPAPTKMEALNYQVQQEHGVHALYRTTGRNLDGTGIAVAMGDGGAIRHQDYVANITRFDGFESSGHAAHVAGIMAGHGYIDPTLRGMAPEIKLVVDYYDYVLVNTPSYITNYNATLTNNSYGGSFSCTTSGDYDSGSQYVDIQMTSYAKLLHVFAAGNAGTATCSPYPATYNTVLNGYQSAKNTLSVGNIQKDLTLLPGSAVGPTTDGRIKPEVVAIGSAVYSTGYSDDYFGTGGTSMSSPATVGIAALLEQRYKQLNGGTAPDGALVKAILCNTADDLGNPAPDYKYGYGAVNARRAVEAIEATHYLTSSVANAVTNTHTISVPSGTHAQLRVMIYWNDPFGSLASSTALVNDLDLTVTTPAASVVLPWKLDATPANVANNATRAADHLNNIEQVTIDAPATGTYTVSVKGNAVPSGPQSYYMTWELLEPAVTVAFPLGDETLVPTETETLHWDAYDPDTNTFTAEYSTNNGSSWTTLSATIPATSRLFNFTVPTPTGGVTTQALVRVTRNGGGAADVSDAVFTIMGVPNLALVSPCAGYAQLDWTAVTGATDYEVFQLYNGVFTSLGTTAAISQLVPNLVGGETYFFAVCARKSGVRGRRCYALSVVVASAGNCAGAAFTSDLELTAITSPVSGRANTSSALSATQPVSLQIRNLGNTAYNAATTLQYTVNGGAPVSQAATLSIAAGGSLAFTFSTTANLAAAGTYTIVATVTGTGDAQTANNTRTVVVRQIPNPAAALPLTEGFETASAATYRAATTGLTGLDRWDFNTSDGKGRARTYIDASFTITGNRLLALDEILYDTLTTVASGTMTLNLAAYTASELRLDLTYLNMGQETHPNGGVYIRGNDTAPWVFAYDLLLNNPDYGVSKTAQGINITDLLTAAGQTVSSSFQIKLVQEGENSIAWTYYGDGYLFDDLKIYTITTDLEASALAAPATCTTFGSNVVATFRNSGAAAIAAGTYPTSYIITAPDGTVSSTVVGSMVLAAPLASKASTNYTFTTPYTFTQRGTYAVQISVTFADDLPTNNTATFEVVNNAAASIATFPYLENFEATDGGYTPEGTSSDWTWGTPAKTQLNAAASGTKCWVTKTSGNYSDGQQTYLYTPCFDLTSLTNPVLSFSHNFETEYCPAPDHCDYFWTEYSTDYGKTWTRLGAQGNGTNWYDDAVQGFTNTLLNTKWHVASQDLPPAANSTHTRLRFMFHSDGATNYEGVAIDDVHIFEKQPIYTGVSLSSGITQTVTGSSWTTFVSGGNRLVQINPNGQNLGATTVKTFINSGTVRNAFNQYYLDRNFVITPTTQPSSAVRVRLYLTNAEANALVNASGCGACTGITDAYALGVTKYSGSSEDNNVANNSGGATTFIAPAAVDIVPFDNGYYAEFSVTSFSEFWLNGGGALQNQPLPVTWLSFTATREGKNALLTWRTATEERTDRFEVEAANSAGSFERIGSVKAAGNSTAPRAYIFTDTRTGLCETQLYRLREYDLDGNSNYSIIRPLAFVCGNGVQIYPNPSSGLFEVILEVGSSFDTDVATVVDMAGRELWQTHLESDTHTRQHLTVDLSAARFASGVYTLHIGTNVFRLVKL